MTRYKINAWNSISDSNKKCKIDLHNEKLLKLPSFWMLREQSNVFRVSEYSCLYWKRLLPFLYHFKALPQLWSFVRMCVTVKRSRTSQLKLCAFFTSNIFTFHIYEFLLVFFFFLMRHHQHLLSCGTRCLRLEGLRVTKRSWVDYWFVASVFPINIIYQH